MKNINKALILILCFVIYGQSQTQSEKAVAKIVSKLGNKEVVDIIYLSDVEKAKESLKQHPDFSLHSFSSDELFKVALDKVIEEILLKREAEKEKIEPYGYEIEEEIKNIKRNIAISEGLSDFQSKKVEEIFNEKLKQQNITLQELKDNIRKKIQVEKLLDSKIKSKVKKPTESELKNFFDDIMKVFKSTTNLNFGSDEENEFYLALSEKIKEAFGERVRYRQILIKPNSYNEIDKKKATEKALNIKKRILNGEDFESLAALESHDIMTAKNGGEVGYVFRGDLPQNIENVVFSLNPGEISEPIWIDMGCIIVQVIERKIAEKPKFEKIKQDLENILMQKRYMQEVKNYISELKRKANITIY
ncbi:MAG: peptidylprolyl isomerase [Elusimicrobiales bacterium]|nr:peptidylprolyl isomerase [Elusimicrobiales bacterium]